MEHLPLDEVKLLQEENRLLRIGIQAVGFLISDSEGVYGLHLNGDVAPWETLEAGGEFEDWLFEFNEAETLLKKKKLQG